MNLEELRQQWTVAQTSAAAAHAFWELYAAGPGGNPSPVTDSDPALQLVLQHEMIRPGSAVLDLGCGTGRYAAWFAQKGCRVTCFDLSETAAAQARQRFREAGLPDAEFVTGDWHGMQPGALDWDRKFDLVFCHMSPAVQSYDTFERLYRCSRGWCLMAKPTFRKDAVSQYLIGKLGLTDVHRPFEEDMSYAFTYLILHGLRPYTEYYDVTWRRARTEEQAVRHYSAWLQTNYGVTEDQLPELRRLIHEICRDGPIQEEESILVSMLYWKVE
jgi:SAM-dependent methyltransferase